MMHLAGRVLRRPREAPPGGPGAEAPLPLASTPPPLAAAVEPSGSPYWPAVLPAMVAWNAASVTVILYNKFLYSGPFPHPITLTALHMAANTFFTQGLVQCGALGVPELGWGTYLRVIPGLGALFAGSLACSNLAAARMPVATVQMLKALAPLLTVATMFAMGTERFRPALLLVALLMTLGVGVASYGEAHFDAVGAALQLAALLCESVRMVCIQATIQASLPKANPLAALALFAPMCAACLLPLSLVMEPGVLAALLGSGAGDRDLLLLLSGNAVAAIAINVCAVWLLSQNSGPLLVTLVGVLKDVQLIVFSVFLFGSPITHMQCAGYSVALLGINAYHVLKTPGGANLSPLQLLRAAFSNHMAAAMGLGILGLVAIAR